MAKFCKSGVKPVWLLLELLELIQKNKILLSVVIMDGMIGTCTNLQKSDNLDKQLLPGLKTDGVSSSYKGSIKPFYYNDIKSLEKIFLKK